MSLNLELTEASVGMQEDCTQDEAVKEFEAGRGLFIGSGCPEGNWDCNFSLNEDGKVTLKRRIISFTRKNEKVKTIIPLFFVRMELNNPEGNQNKGIKASADISANEVMMNVIKSGDLKKGFGVSAVKPEGTNFSRTEFQVDEFYGKDWKPAEPVAN